MEQVSKTNQDLIAIGMHNVIANGELGEFNVFWAFGKPQLNFPKKISTEEFTAKNKDTKVLSSLGEHEAHVVLKLNNWNKVVYCWKTTAHKREGKFLYTGDKEVKTGLHAGNIGMMKNGELVYVPDAVEGGDAPKTKANNPF